MIIQGTEEWFQARLGKATASRMVDVMASIKKGEAASRRNYKAELVQERMTGIKEDRFVSYDMQWGIDKEPDARMAYSFLTGNEVEQVGFVEHPFILMTGASPDGRIGTYGGLEIKCPKTATHIDYLRAKVAPTEYQLQMLWQMECDERDWADFVSFDPRMPMELRVFVYRMYRDERRLKEMREEIERFNDEVAEMVIQLQAIADCDGYMQILPKPIEDDNPTEEQES